jgi:non-ribosomal peptide synthetase component E (peptide arylation enzyme)
MPDTGLFGLVACWARVERARTARDHGGAAHALLARARGGVAGYKVPKRVQFMEGIPRLGAGTIDRTGATALIGATAAGPPATGAVPGRSP